MKNNSPTSFDYHQELLLLLTNVKNQENNYQHPDVKKFIANIPHSELSDFLNNSLKKIYEISIIGKQYHLGGLLFISVFMNKNYPDLKVHQSKLLPEVYKFFLQLEERKNEYTEKTYETMQVELTKFLTNHQIAIDNCNDNLKKQLSDFLSKEFNFKNSNKIINKMLNLTENEPTPNKVAKKAKINN